MDHQFWVLAVFMVLMDLSICVNVNGPMVLGFGGFHGFDGPVHVHEPLVLGFGGFHSFDGPVHLCVCTWATGFGFWQFSQF